MGKVPIELIWNGSQPVVVLKNLANSFPAEPFWADSAAHAEGRPELLPLKMAEPGFSAPQGFIFHMSRCGSTLVSRMLQAADQVVLSEPLQLQRLLTDGQISREERIFYLQRLLGLYQTGLSRDQGGTVVKWSSACTRHVKLIQEAFPEVPCVFVHRQPEAVLMSYLNDQPTSVPLSALELYAPHLRPAPGAQRSEICARYIASTCHFASQAKDFSLLDYQDIYNAVVNDLVHLFGIPMDDKMRQKMLEATKFHAKDITPRTEFDPLEEMRQRVPAPHVVELARQIVWPEIRRLQQSHPQLARKN